jgi:uncharacterized protein
MGSPETVILRVVFDTSTVMSALLFADGRLAWLRQHWDRIACVPLVCSATAAELTRVLLYPKFKLRTEEARELIALYLPCCELIHRLEPCSCICRDANDQPFLDVAQSGRADVLVSSDRDLLVLSGQTEFLIQTPEAYRRKVISIG